MKWFCRKKEPPKKKYHFVYFKFITLRDGVNSVNPGKLEIAQRVVFIKKGIEEVEDLYSPFLDDNSFLLSLKVDPPGFVPSHDFKTGEKYPLGDKLCRASMIRLYSTLEEVLTNHFCDLL